MKFRLGHILFNFFLQHGGDMERAAQFMDEARCLDTADRYVNCKCAKYQLRANQVQKAEETCGLFTRVCKYLHCLTFSTLFY